MATHPLLELNKLGQSVWLDNLSRPLVRSGELARLVAEDGITGVTSNPAIFRKAMTEGDAYDEAIARLAQEGRSTMEIYEALAITDIQDACDVLLPVYQRTEGRDGFISLEVSPLLAADTEGTVTEAARLWKAVDRSNLLIKIPGTPEGVPAVEACLARGINVNVTLLFSLEAHEAVIDAHIRGRRLGRTVGPRRPRTVDVRHQRNSPNRLRFRAPFGTDESAIRNPQSAIDIAPRGRPPRRHRLAIRRRERPHHDLRAGHQHRPAEGGAGLLYHRRRRQLLGVVVPNHAPIETPRTALPVDVHQRRVARAAHLGPVRIPQVATIQRTHLAVAVNVAGQDG